MPFYGTDLNAMIDIKSDRAYSAYFSPAKKNIIVREAIIKAIDKKVATNDRLMVQDDLFGIFKTNIPFAVAGNQLAVTQGGAGISDYYHLMNLVATFQVTHNAYVIGATATTPCRITINRPTVLRTGDSIVISGVTGATNANGTRYLKQLSGTVYELYSNVALSAPVVGNGTFSGVSAAIIQNVSNYCKNMSAPEKFSSLNEATIHVPYFEIGSTYIKVYPQTVNCSSVIADYISVPPQVDITDGVTDLLAVFSERFIEFIADESCRLMGMYSRDAELQINEQSEITQQP